MASLRALALCCSLKKSPAASSSELIAREILTALADHDVRFGVSTDEGDGDAWPRLRERLMAADILVLATPIWLGQPSSVCRLVLERLDRRGVPGAQRRRFHRSRRRRHILGRGSDEHH
jgi:multimeric flavodoxin WrbA